MTRTLDNISPGGGAFFSVSAKNIEAGEKVSAPNITATQRLTAQNITVNEDLTVAGHITAASITIEGGELGDPGPATLPDDIDVTSVTAQQITATDHLTAGEVTVEGKLTADSIEVKTISAEEITGVDLGGGDSYEEIEYEAGLMIFDHQGGTPVIRNTPPSNPGPIKIHFKIGKVGKMCVARMIYATPDFDLPEPEGYDTPLCIQFDIPESYRPAMDENLLFIYREHPNGDKWEVNTHLGVAYRSVSGYGDATGDYEFNHLIVGPNSGPGLSYSELPAGTYSIPRQTFSWLTA